jgi:Uma2 family endonuclease
MIEQRSDGQARIDTEGYVVGGPELVAEVTASSTSIDLNTKLTVYQRNGVREYIVWRVLDHAVDWFVLRQGQYETLTPASDGCLHSDVFPGLWLDVQAMLGLQLAAVLHVL